MDKKGVVIPRDGPAAHGLYVRFIDDNETEGLGKVTVTADPEQKAGVRVPGKIKTALEQDQSGSREDQEADLRETDEPSGTPEKAIERIGKRNGHGMKCIKNRGKEQSIIKGSGFRVPSRDATVRFTRKPEPFSGMKPLRVNSDITAIRKSFIQPGTRNSKPGTFSFHSFGLNRIRNSAPAPGTFRMSIVPLS